MIPTASLRMPFLQLDSLLTCWLSRQSSNEIQSLCCISRSDAVYIRYSAAETSPSNYNLCTKTDALRPRPSCTNHRTNLSVCACPIHHFNQISNLHPYSATSDAILQHPCLPFRAHVDARFVSAPRLGPSDTCVTVPITQPFISVPLQHLLFSLCFLSNPSPTSPSHTSSPSLTPFSIIPHDG